MYKLKQLFPQQLKNIYHLFQAILANAIFGFPSRNIKIIGITGTNGKTTTVQMTAKILEEAGFKAAVASTINFKIGEKEWINKTKFTTVSSFAIQKLIRRAVKEGCEYLVLETSSHSLDQHRVWGINYDVAVITNVTREHLDYHKDIKKYRESKYKLFENVNTAIVNLDMERPEYYLSCGAKNKFGYSTQISPLPPTPSPAGKSLPAGRQGWGEGYQKVVAENIELETNNSKFMIHDSKFMIHLLGLFNIENALAATCAGLSQGISLETISKALEKIKGVPGRMEYVPNDKDLNIIVDYAVTPDSLGKLYELIAKIKGAKLPIGSLAPKIIAVFGSCGERDRGKRPIMGEIVSRFADYIIITNEDPYNEDAEQIINEVFSGVVSCEVEEESPNYKFQIINDKSNPNDQIQKLANSLSPRPPLPSGEGGRRPGEGEKVESINAWRILDRREAIKKALLLAKPGDFVIVTGKGAEETMAIGKKRIPWNDKKVILEELKKN